MQTIHLMLGDCVLRLEELGDGSVDAFIMDPPYDLTSATKRDKGTAPKGGFMGKTWDATGIAFDPEFWRLLARKLKPLGVIKSFGGTRTYHRMVRAMRLAGLEVRQIHAWSYASGFPKSTNVGKKLDSMERNTWKDISNAIDSIDVPGIVREWQKSSEHVGFAGTQFPKSPIAIGTSTQKKDSALRFALVSVNINLPHANAIIAELQSFVPPPKIKGSTLFVRENVEGTTGVLSALVGIVENTYVDLGVSLCPKNPTVPENARAWPNGNQDLSLRVDEALRIWLGNKPFSKQAAINALCVLLTDILKLIILRQSKIFQNLDIPSQMGFASATTVTTTASTAVNLISYMVATLKNLAEIRLHEATRQVVGYKRGVGGENLNDILHGKSVRSTTDKGGRGVGAYGTGAKQVAINVPITAPATENAKLWDGYGTAMKPSWEPIVIARKVA